METKKLKSETIIQYWFALITTLAVPVGLYYFSSIETTLIEVREATAALKTEIKWLKEVQDEHKLLINRNYVQKTAQYGTNRQWIKSGEFYCFDIQGYER